MNQSQFQEAYFRLLNKKRQELIDIYPLDSKNRWKKDTFNKYVTIYTLKDHRTGLKVVRAQSKVNAPKEKVIEIVENLGAILEWDKTLDDIKAIERTKDYTIVYAIVKKMAMTTRRETVMLTRFYFENDGTIIGVGTSIEHPAVPRIKHRVRATVHLCGWVLKPIPGEPNATDFTCVFHIDPEGWIPTTVFNWFAHEQGFNIKPFGDYTERKWRQELELTKREAERNAKNDGNTGQGNSSHLQKGNSGLAIC